MKGCFMFHGESVFQIRGALFLSGGGHPMGGASVLVLGGRFEKNRKMGGPPPPPGAPPPPLWEALDIRYYNNAHDTSTVFFKN